MKLSKRLNWNLLMWLLNCNNFKSISMTFQWINIENLTENLSTSTSNRSWRWNPYQKEIKLKCQKFLNILLTTNCINFPDILYIALKLSVLISHFLYSLPLSISLTHSLTFFQASCKIFHSFIHLYPVL